ncbi:hypothetical protein AGMMS50267_09250 [Spirochaetia bacterium]|nr:hypothetical protein AGMMS50267_09250 [Spirochaetia bacterium]
MFVVAAVIFIVGFSKRGINFIKYGFGQTTLDSSLEKRFDDLTATIKGLADKVANIKDDMSNLDAKIVAIETNHFGHLKNFLTELTSILLDKDVINNTDKARLDNELRGM